MRGEGSGLVRGLLGLGSMLLLAGCGAGSGAGYPRTMLKPVAGDVVISPDQRSLTVFASWGDCQLKPQLIAVQGPSRVALELRYRERAAKVACLYQLRGGDVSARLDRPLGDRVLVQALSGRPIPARQIRSR